MWFQLLLAAGTAVASSVLTLALAGYIYRHYLHREVERHVQDALEQLGEEVEERVRQGVRDGIREGVASLPSTEVIADATRTAARSGVDILGGLLGRASGRRGSDV